MSGRRQMVVPRKPQQEPAEHETDRQAPDVSEKDACDRLVEGRKAKDRAEQRGCDHCRHKATAPARPSRTMRAGHRHKLRHRHPVDAVHEIDEVDEPDPADKKARSRSSHQGTCGRTRNSVRKRRDQDADCDALHRQPHRRRQRAQSSIAPTTPNSAAVAVSATNCPPSFCSRAGDVATVAQVTTKVATTTDIPPPCGVG